MQARHLASIPVTKKATARDKARGHTAGTGATDRGQARGRTIKLSHTPNVRSLLRDEEERRHTPGKSNIVSSLDGFLHLIIIA